MYLDQFGNPLPAGTALRVPALFHHQGIVDYDDATGEQVMLHNSKKRGQVAQTDPSEFNNGRFPVALARPLPVDRLPVIVRSAREDVQSGRRWTVFDNCQDFVSRAYDGHDGSATRTFIVGALLVSGLLWALSAE